MKKIYLATLALIVSLAVMAAPRTVEQAAEIAAQFTNNQPQLSQMHKAPRKAANMRLAHTSLQQNSNNAAFYIFNNEDNGGFVIVSADDRTAVEILGYSDSGAFDFEHANPNFKWWLSRYEKEITKLQTLHDSVFTEVPAMRKAQQVTAIGPLLKTKNGEEIKWYQEAPFYNLCPKDQTDNTRSLTGCVATAASQIMCSWAYPEKGTGEHTNNWDNSLSGGSGSGSEYANFGETYYDWDNMIGQYAKFNYSNQNVELSGITEAQKTAVATLMYHAGIACDMVYGGDRVGGSGSWTDNMGVGMQKYFGYTFEKFVTNYSQSEYKSLKQRAGESLYNIPSEWGVSSTKIAEYFNADLEAGRPILMGGDSYWSGGHEFVCDGRNSNGQFHINWGWNGDDNGYFALTALKPSGYNFSENIDAIIGLEPDNKEPVAVTGVTVSPTSITLKVNESKTLSATVLPADATTKSVTWHSDDESIVTVDKDGNIRGVGEGFALISVTTKDGGFSDVCEVKVSGIIVYNPNFVRLTSINDLAVDDDIIFVNESKKKAAGLKMAGNNNTKYMYPVTVDIQDGVIALPETTEVAIMTVGGSKGKWTLTSQDDKLLGTTANKKLTWGGGTTTWDISLSGTNASIASTKSSYGKVLYNISAERFCNYASDPNDNQVHPQIYIRKKQAEPTAVDEITNSNSESRKYIINGQIVILRDGVKYNVLGQIIE